MTAIDEIAANEASLSAEVESVLAAAKRAGATDAEVSASQSTGLEVVVRRQDIETLEYTRHHRLSITVYLGQQKGSASTADSSPEAVERTVRAALNIARHTQADEYSGLVAAELMAGSRPELDLLHPWDIDASGAEALALTCEAAALEVPGVFDTEGAAVGSDLVTGVYGNSNGFIGVHSGSRHSMSCAALAQDDRGKQRDYAMSMVRDPAALDDAASLGREAGELTAAHLGVGTVPTGTMPVLFTPRMTRTLVSHLLDAMSGGSIYRNASFLKDQLGEPVTAAHFSLQEKPQLPGALGSRYHDGDGVATREQFFIREGELCSYLLGGYSARRLGLETTGNAGGAHNVCLTGRTLTVGEMMAEMGDGVLVTSLMGQGVNIVNGDFSRGARGYRIAGGEVAHPIDEFTIAANLKDMYMNIVALGDDVNREGNIQAPSMLVSDMTVAGR